MSTYLYPWRDKTMANDTFFADAPTHTNQREKVKDFLNLQIIPSLPANIKKKVLEAESVKMPKGIALTLDNNILKSIRAQAEAYAIANPKDENGFEFILVGRVHLGDDTEKELVQFS